MVEKSSPRVGIELYPVRVKTFNDHFLFPAIQESFYPRMSRSSKIIVVHLQKP